MNNECSPLNKWSMCGMNHYYVKDKKQLFVSITKDGSYSIFISSIDNLQQ